MHLYSFFGNSIMRKTHEHMNILSTQLLLLLHSSSTSPEITEWFVGTRKKKKMRNGKEVFLTLITNDLNTKYWTRSIWYPARIEVKRLSKGKSRLKENNMRGWYNERYILIANDAVAPEFSFFPSWTRRREERQLNEVGPVSGQKCVQKKRHIEHMM